jgi:DNA repair exonuclease SbcCD ATPase subunit
MLRSELVALNQEMNHAVARAKAAEKGNAKLSHRSVVILTCFPTALSEARSESLRLSAEARTKEKEIQALEERLAASGELVEQQRSEQQQVADVKEEIRLLKEKMEERERQVLEVQNRLSEEKKELEEARASIKNQAET